jgi:hypothetical protein
MHTKIKEYVLALIIIATFITYYFDLLKDGMVMSGIFAVIIMVYISMIWAEKVEDERDEYIRAKVGRILYIITLTVLLVDIVYKTFTHQSYMSEVVILTILSLSKIVLSKAVKGNS